MAQEYKLILKHADEPGYTRDIDCYVRHGGYEALKKALAHLKKTKVKIEDPGDEIGPEAPGSKNMGIWFYDIDGYRWELSVQAKR